VVIDREHGIAEVLMLLWRGIAQYATNMGLRYLLGCSSLNSNDPAEGWRTFRRFENVRVPREFETAPTAAYACPPEPQDADLQDADAQPLPCQTDRLLPEGSHATPATQGKVPRLLKTCLAIGARIAVPSAWDREFRTLDFLTLLDLKFLSAAVRNRFLAPLTS
jgi:putative hemolysin